MTTHALSEEQKNIIRSLDAVPTVSLEKDLYPELVAAGLVERFQVLSTALYRYRPTEKGRAATLPISKGKP